MSMVNCRECGKEVSSEAKSCPHCGIKKPAPKKPTSTLTKVVAAGVVGWMAFAITTQADKPQSDELREYQALAMCQEALTKASRDPASAEVPSVPNVGHADFYFVWNSQTKPTRMKNGFGALLAASASCTVSKETKRITSLSLDGQSLI